MEIAYKGFCWSLGITSFRTKDFNRTIESQIEMLSRFWELPENRQAAWNNETQRRYYYFMQNESFVTGNAPHPDKDARQKTSGLVDIGLVDISRRLTAVGKVLLEIATEGDFSSDNIFGIEKDSYIYLKQLLKTYCEVEQDVVRPMMILIHFLIEATLANNSNQRHMESEPVTRHLGNDILESGNTNSYCVFVSPTLNPNVISDFRLRQNMVWYDVSDTSHKVNGLKIIPLTTEDIRRILTGLSRYKALYVRFDEAFNDTSYPDPIEWYRNCVAF